MQLADVRFGSKADSCSAKGYVRFAPNSDRKSGHGSKTGGYNRQVVFFKWKDVRFAPKSGHVQCN
jgi:hypothetical protein